MFDRLKHAFAVESPGATPVSNDEREMVDRICREVVRRRLVTPALMLLEMSRPLNFIGSQLMRFFQPFVAAVLPVGGYGRFAAFLERRGSIETLCRRLEEFEAGVPADPAETDNTDAPEDDGHALA